MAIDETIPDVMDTGPWSNADVAAHLGISLVHLSRIRQGRRYPSRLLMRKIQEKLGWTYSDQVRVGDKPDPLAYAKELQKFLLDNFHVPTSIIQRKEMLAVEHPESICPVAGCRTGYLVNLQAHIENKHPGYHNTAKKDA